MALSNAKKKTVWLQSQHDRGLTGVLYMEETFHKLKNDKT